MEDRSRRFKETLEAFIETEGKAIRGNVINISTEGLCIEIPRTFNITDECKIIIYFPAPTKIKAIKKWEKIAGINKKVGLSIISKDNNWDSFLSSYHLDLIGK
jgi:predicted nucleotidyltransferase